MSEVRISTVIVRLRPRVARERTVSLEEVAAEIAEQSGFDYGDVRAIVYKLARVVVRHLEAGESVKLEELGAFSVACDRYGKLRVGYRPSAFFRRALARDFQGTILNRAHAKLDDEGYAALWLESHPEDTVIMRDGSRRRL